MTGQELTLFRTQYGETQAELAGAIGVYHPSISEWERGLYKMSRVNARLIRQYYEKKELQLAN
jgi:transcriptional regulator with XRE-family HTH domain